MNSEQQLTITPLTREDLPEVFRLFEQSISDAFEQEGLSHLSEDVAREVEHKQNLALDSLDQNGADRFFLTARLQERIVGTISFGPCGESVTDFTEGELDDVGELGSLYILPGVQNQGIGSALIEALLIRVHGLGQEQFCLDSGYRRAQVRWQRKFGPPYRVVQDCWGPGSVHMIWLCQVSDHIT